MSVITEKVIYLIGELSGLTGTSPRTIRYYEEISLLDHPKRKGNKRIYNMEDVRRLKFIKRLKLMGLSLAEMSELKKIYHIHRSNSKVLMRLLELLNYHEAQLDEKLSALKKLKKEITSYKVRIQKKLKDNNQH